MRGKRSKQYRKLMNQYALSFNFREPYQVLVDAEMIEAAARFKMDLVPSLERTLHGKVKPMITQCSIRHLYTSPAQDKDMWINTARMFERRRCNHHELPEPLSTYECLNEVVDPKSGGVNKHRYVVASQDSKVRASMREKAGVPMVYINRSVMIMEPMAARTEEVRHQEEVSKFRAGLKGRRGGPPTPNASTKRTRDEFESDDESGEPKDGTSGDGDLAQTPKKRRKGPKQPNPLSVKKASKKAPGAAKEDEAKAIRKATKNDPQAAQKALLPESAAAGTDADDGTQKRKRKRRHRTDAAPEQDETIET